MSKFNHAFDIAFEVISEKENGSDVTGEMLREGLERRMAELDSSGDIAWGQAVDRFDTFEEEPGDIESAGAILHRMYVGDDLTKRRQLHEAKVEADHEQRLHDEGRLRADDERDPDLVSLNSSWQRKSDWPFEEDFQSPKWHRRSKRSDRKVQIGRELYGFVTCPECGVMHTAPTVSCRGCGHKAEITEERRAFVEEQVTKELGDGSEFKYAPGKGPDDVLTTQAALEEGQSGDKQSS